MKQCGHLPSLQHYAKTIGEASQWSLPGSMGEVGGRGLPTLQEELSSSHIHPIRVVDAYSDIFCQFPQRISAFPVWLLGFP